MLAHIPVRPDNILEHTLEKELSGSIFAHICASFVISHIGTKQVVGDNKVEFDP
jgi:hypothetical protein